MTSQLPTQIGTLTPIILVLCSDCLFLGSDSTIVSAVAQPLVNYDVCAELLKSLPLSSVEVLEMPHWSDSLSFPSSVFSSFTSLSTLLLGVPSGGVIDLSTLTALQNVTIQRQSNFFEWDSFSAQFDGSKTSLQQLTASARVLDVQDLVQFVALQKLSIVLDSNTPAAQVNPLALPPSLTDLTVLNIPARAFKIVSSSLKALRLNGPSSTLLTLPNTLRSLYITGPAITSWPSTFPTDLEELTIFGATSAGVNLGGSAFSGCTRLERLTLSLLNDPSWDNFPSLAATALKQLTITQVQTSESSIPVERILCSAPSATVTHVSFKGTKFLALPPCISQFTALQSLNILSGDLLEQPNFFENVTAPGLRELRMNTKPWGQSPEWEVLVAKFPNLEILEVIPVVSLDMLPFPSQTLMSLSQLRVLILSNLLMVGSLPSNWFLAFPNLEILNVRYNRLNGTVPTAGWAKLKDVRISINAFSEFPYIEAPGAPELRHLEVDGNRLVSLPNDAVWAQSPQLRSASVQGNRFVDTPLPRFWASSASHVEIFTAFNSGFRGTIPPISNPHLIHVGLDINKLCGPLPEATRTLDIGTMNLANNALQGTIPASWGTLMTVTTQLALSNNYLNGTIPNPLLMPHISNGLITSLRLDNNYFTGPLFNLSGYTSLQIWQMQGANMTLNDCAQNPDFEPSNAATCTFNSQFGCTCPRYWDGCSGLMSTCISPATPENSPFEDTPAPTPILPPEFMCIQPPERPGPPIPPGACAGAPPAVGTFSCVNGVWISYSSIDVPTLSIPPGSTVLLQGNLSIGASLEIQGFGSSLVVNGCIFLLDGIEITVTISEEELKELERLKGEIEVIILKSTDTDCMGSSDLSNLKIDAKVTTKTCKRVTANANADSNQQTLNVTFRLDSSKCRVWWIVLASVLGSIAIIVTAVSVAAIFNPTIRKLFKPFARK